MAAWNASALGRARINARACSHEARKSSSSAGGTSKRLISTTAPAGSRPAEPGPAGSGPAGASSSATTWYRDGWDAYGSCRPGNPRAEMAAWKSPGGHQVGGHHRVVGQVDLLDLVLPGHLQQVGDVAVEQAPHRDDPLRGPLAGGLAQRRHAGDDVGDRLGHALDAEALLAPSHHVQPPVGMAPHVTDLGDAADRVVDRGAADLVAVDDRDHPEAALAVEH